LSVLIGGGGLSGTVLLADLPLIIALIQAAVASSSGLHAPVPSPSQDILVSAMECIIDGR